jgi:CMP-N,N'-diacetyllegionaminic acid synthase
MNPIPQPHNTLAFIPCRTKSRRLPGKNLLEIGGRSLVFRAVDFALSMGFLVVVAPDEEAVADLLRVEYGQRIHIFLRDAELADGNHQLESWAQAHDAIEQITNTVYPYGVMFEPSSPVRNKDDVLTTLGKLAHFPAAATVSMNERLRPGKLFVIQGAHIDQFSLDGRIMWPGNIEGEIVQFNGVCYAARKDTIQRQSLFVNLVGHVVETPTFNIDTQKDLDMARAYETPRLQMYRYNHNTGCFEIHPYAHDTDFLADERRADGLDAYAEGVLSHYFGKGEGEGATAGYLKLAVLLCAFIGLVAWGLVAYSSG